MEEKTNIFALTKQDTAVLKGIAIIAMLMHHLWGCPPDWVDPYTGVLGFFGNVGKVCVAIFLFCSGYGLSVGYSKVVDGLQCTMHDCKKGFIDTLKFLAKRFVKFYAGYWPIFLIFVPISIWGFGRTLMDAYGVDANMYKCLICDVLGVGGFGSYNITWWFNALILGLYLSFPILFWLGKKWPWVLLIVSLLVVRLGGRGWSGMMPTFMLYQMPFVFGILWNRWEYIGERMIKSTNRWLLFVVGIVLLVGAVTCREIEVISHWSGMRMDGVITLALVVLVIAARRLVMTNKCFAYLGKHSMNIYMMHTFIFGYWFQNIFYSCELGGGMNVLTILIICTGFSVLIEWVKNYTKWTKLSENICQKLS